MEFEISKTLEILRQTPKTLEQMLSRLSPEWSEFGGGFNNWSPYDVVGHLIHCEEADWIPRAEIILARDEDRPFKPLDRLAQFERSAGKSLGDLLKEFERLRTENLDRLAGWDLTDDHLALTGTHPDLGQVTLGQLLATWAVHDLNHIGQISAFMAQKYAENVGPWKQYLSILK